MTGVRRSAFSRQDMNWPVASNPLVVISTRFNRTLGVVSRTPSAGFNSICADLNFVIRAAEDLCARSFHRPHVTLALDDLLFAPSCTWEIPNSTFFDNDCGTRHNRDLVIVRCRITGDDAILQILLHALVAGGQLAHVFIGAVSNCHWNSGVDRLSVVG